MNCPRCGNLVVQTSTRGQQRVYCSRRCQEYTNSRRQFLRGRSARVVAADGAPGLIRGLRLTPAGERVAFEQALERLMALPPPWLT